MVPSKNNKTFDLNTREVMSFFPKVELHRHLEGTFHIPTLYKIAQTNKVESPTQFEEFKESVQFPKDSEPDFLKFLSKFRNDWYRSFEDIKSITYDSLLKMKDEGMFYSEIRFSPEHFAFFNDFNRMEVSRLIIEAGNRAAKDGNFHLNYLVTFNRSKQDEKEMLELYQDISKLNIPQIVGIDLAGDELNFPPTNFVKFFDFVKKDNKFGITIHAGEVTPSTAIWEAIDKLHANRIGHGTSTISDEKLQKALIERKITLEQCITSNYQTGSWDDPSTHPLGRLFRLGIPVSINTDDPHIQDCDLTDEYLTVMKYFNFNLKDFVDINHMTLEGAFVEQKRKDQLHKDYDARVADFKKKFKL